MTEKANPRSNLKMIRGGLQCEMIFGPVRIIAAPENKPPFEVDAVAYEEDTWLIMSADPKVCEPEEHPIRLMTDLMNCRPEPVGSVRVKGKNPLRFLAVVHDVDQDPTWKEEWVEKALVNIFQEAEQRRLGAIGLPMLGTRHGKLEYNRFAELLGKALTQSILKHLRRLWLMAPIDKNRKIIRVLKTVLTNL